MILEQEIHEKELEQLVSLAEDIAKKVETLESKSDRTDYVIIISVFLISFSAICSIFYYQLGYALIVSLGFSLLIGILTTLTILTIIANLFFLGNQRSKIKLEQQNLKELLDIIHNHKELTYRDMSVISKVVYEMRLNRINFSVGYTKPSKEPRTRYNQVKMKLEQA